MKVKSSVFWYGHVLLAFFVSAGFAAPPQNQPAALLRLDDGPEGCTVIMVGKEASTDGSVMTTHAADCGVCDWTWRHVPAAKHKPGQTRKIYHIHQIRTWPPSEGD